MFVQTLAFLFLLYVPNEALKCHQIDAAPSYTPNDNDVADCPKGTSFCYQTFANGTYKDDPSKYITLGFYGCDTNNTYCQSGAGCYGWGTAVNTCCCNRDKCNHDMKSSSQKWIVISIAVSLLAFAYKG